MLGFYHCLWDGKASCRAQRGALLHLPRRFVVLTQEEPPFRARSRASAGKVRKAIHEFSRIHEPRAPVCRSERRKNPPSAPIP